MFSCPKVDLASLQCREPNLFLGFCAAQLFIKRKMILPNKRKKKEAETAFRSGKNQLRKSFFFFFFNKANWKLWRTPIICSLKKYRFRYFLVGKEAKLSLSPRYFWLVSQSRPIMGTEENHTQTFGTKFLLVSVCNANFWERFQF